MELSSRPDKTILQALEENGFQPENHCRNGFCGMCRSQVNPADLQNIRVSDDALAFHDPMTEILPCVSYLEEGSLDIEINSTGQQVRLLSPEKTTLLNGIDANKLDNIRGQSPSITTSIVPG
ncbi:2Fe-2S iron-sulfur cluster binding domain-containing protein [uncultured Amphritea sp.]|uniref:2Fe-2S iron-sulfur cluster-binding protein n=1 Tax=uncultured Amphritea sp. TaxID=981605 RepID=UPI0026120920|nr:2Fe-2S iron-sulfur cluster binding domain-containing protein [uncultured Amphritea sp.]